MKRYKVMYDGVAKNSRFFNFCTVPVADSVAKIEKNITTNKKSEKFG